MICHSMKLLFRRVCVCFLFLFCCLVSTFSFISLPASALDLSVSVQLVNYASNPSTTYTWLTSSGLVRTYAGRGFATLSPGERFQNDYGMLISNDQVGSYYIQKGDYFSVWLALTSIRNSSGHCSLDFDNRWRWDTAGDIVVATELSSSVSENICQYLYRIDLFANQTYSSGRVEIRPDYLGADGANLQVAVTSWQQYRPVNVNPNVNVDVDQSGVISAVQGMQSYQQATTNAVNSLKESQHADNQAILQQQQQQTQAVREQTEAVKDQTEAVKEQTEAVNKGVDFITDDTQPSASDIASSDSIPSVGLLPAGPLDSILLLPLNLMNSILSSLGGNCSPVVAPVPFLEGKNLTLPCFGDTLYSGDFAPLEALFGLPASAVILYYYFKHLYKKVDRAISLETNDEDEWGVL